MKKRWIALMSVIVCLGLVLSFAVPALAKISSTNDSLIANHNRLGDPTICSRCGKPLNGNIGEQSSIADALGLTLCTECWLQLLYGNDYSTPILKVAQLGEDGKVLPAQLPAGQGGITGEGLDAVFTSNGLLKRAGTATYTVDDNSYVTGTPWTSMGYVTGTPWTGMGYLTANQNITLSGDLSGSGTTSISGTVTGLKGAVLPVLSTGYLYYTGSSFVWQTPSSGGFDPVATVTLWDDFISGLLTTGNIGDLGWGLTGTAPTVIASVANHNGIRQIPTTTTSGNISTIWLGGAVATDTILYNDYCDTTFIVRMTDITSDTAFAGAMDAMGTAVGNQDRYGFEYIDSTDTYWMMVTGNGSSSTRTATNVIVATNTWYKFRIVRDVSGVNYYINGSLVGSVTTTLPDTSLNVGLQIQTNTTVAKYLQVDLFSMILGVTR